MIMFLVNSCDQFIHVLQGYSIDIGAITLGQSYDCPSVNGVTLKDIDEINQYLTTKTLYSANCMHYSWDVFSIHTKLM